MKVGLVANPVSARDIRRVIYPRGSKRIVWNLFEYNNEPMLAIATVLEDYMGQYGIVWNSGMVEVAGIEPASY